MEYLLPADRLWLSEVPPKLAELESKIASLESALKPLKDDERYLEQTLERTEIKGVPSFEAFATASNEQACFRSAFRTAESSVAVSRTVPYYPVITPAVTPSVVAADRNHAVVTTRIAIPEAAGYGGYPEYGGTNGAPVQRQQPRKPERGPQYPRGGPYQYPPGPPCARGDPCQ